MAVHRNKRWRWIHPHDRRILVEVLIALGLIGLVTLLAMLLT